MAPACKISDDLHKIVDRWLLLSAATASIALIFTFLRPSDPESAWLLGFSRLRFLLGILTLCGILFLLWLRHDQHFYQKVQSFFTKPENVWFAINGCRFVIFMSLWCFIFSWLFVPTALRPQIIWTGLAALQASIMLKKTYGDQLCSENFSQKYRTFPRFAALSHQQKQVFWLLVMLSVIYIFVLMTANLNGTADMEAFKHYGGDEFVMYPILMNIMTPGENLSATLYHMFIYEDYHYGYPFYVWSALVLLPISLIYGASFPQQIWINLPLLRIFVSVIPVILSAFVLVWIFTRFQNKLISAAVFVFILLAPGTLQNNQGFWHPDGLNLLFVCLTIYFLQRDRLRYGRNFFGAALCAGLSAAIRLYGFFFVLAIAFYLIYGILQKLLPLRQSFLRGCIFLVLMCGTILFADPFLFREDARDKMSAIITEKAGEMSYGYADDYDPRNDYRPGWDAWYPAFEDHYTEMYCFFFLIATVIFCAFVGNERLLYRLLLCWLVMIGGYLIFFVAVKSTQYVLPFLLPLMGMIFSIPLTISQSLTLFGKKHNAILNAVWIICGSIYISQLVINLIKIAPRFGF